MMSDEGKTDLETALTIIGEIDGDLRVAGVPEGFLPVRVRHLLAQWQAEHAAADSFRAMLGSALNADHSDGDAELLRQARADLGYVDWCRQQDLKIRMRDALAFLNSPFSFAGMDLHQLTAEQNQRRRALLALKDLRTAVDGVNQEFAELVDEGELPVARQSCQDITYGMDVLLALLSAREGRENLLALIPDIADGGHLTSSIDEDAKLDKDVAMVTLTLRGPWTPLGIEQHVRGVAAQYAESGKRVQLAIQLNPAG